MTGRVTLQTPHRRSATQLPGRGKYMTTVKKSQKEYRLADILNINAILGLGTCNSQF